MQLSRRTLSIGSAGVLLLATCGSVAFAKAPKSQSSVKPLDPVACSAALSTNDAALLPAIDVLTVAEKTALQARTSALKAALALTDKTQQQTAIKAAQQTYRQATTNAAKAFQTATKSGTDALKVSCGGLGLGSFDILGGGMMGGGPRGSSMPGKFPGVGFPKGLLHSSSKSSI